MLYSYILDYNNLIINNKTLIDSFKKKMYFFNNLKFENFKY